MIPLILCTVLAGLQVNQVEGFSEIRVIKDPEDFTGFMRGFSSLTCEVAGDGITKYEWYHNGTIIPINTDNPGQLPEIFGQRAQTLTIIAAKLKHQGIYQLFITSTWGRIFGRQAKVEYTIVGAFEEGQTKTLNVVIGQFLRIPCPSHGFTRNAVYKWGGHERTQGTWFYPSGDNVIVLDDGTLFFSYVTEEDVERIIHKDGVSCMLDANYKEDTRIEPSSAFILKKVGTNKTSFGPVLEEIPNKEVVKGKYAVLRCIAAGYPTPSYTWEKIDKQGGRQRVIHHLDGVRLTEKNKLLIIENVRKEHAGTYVCTASIEANGTKRTVEKQSTLEVREKPAWREGSLIKSVNPEIFSQHVWTCIAKGDPEPEYEWYANATIMINQSGRHTIEGGILTFHQVTLQDNGMYQCVAKNKYGFQYQTVSMNVKVQSPTITKLDQRTTLMIGKTGVIPCKSEAIPKAVHEWWFNGTILDNKTSKKYEIRNQRDLIIGNVSKSDAGDYKCVAKNIFGEAAAHTMVETAEIIFKIRPQDQLNVKKGDQFSLFCEASSNAPLEIFYKWRFQGRDLKLDDDRRLRANNRKKLIVLKSKHTDSGMYECIAYTKRPSYVEKVTAAEVIVRGVPDAPQNLILQNTCSNFDANLSWTIGYKSPHDPLTSLLLQWRISHDHSTWYNISDNVDTSSDSHVVGGLNPWSNISFRLIAINKYGMSEWSVATDETKCETPAAKSTTCPEDVKGTATKPRIIEITWEEVPTIYRNGPGFNYIVTYRKPQSAWQKRTVDSGSSPRFIITEAGIDQLWEFKVQSSNIKGPGPECPVKTARSEKEAPSLAPESFAVKTIGPTFVILTWKPIDASKQVVLGYKLSYWQRKVSSTINRRSVVKNLCDDRDRPCEVEISGGNTTEYKLADLLPFTEYTLHLRGYNNGGNGPKSNPLTLETKEGKPGPPHHVKSTSYARYIRINWKPPKQPNGRIKGYMVAIKSVRGAKAHESQTTKTEYLFKNLLPEHEYEVYIQAKTSAGAGEEVVKLVNTTSFRVPAVSKAPNVQGIDADSVNVTFNPGDGKGGFPEKFYVMYKEKGKDDKNLKRTNETKIKEDGEKSYIVIGGLENDKMYEFSTVVVNGDLKSDMSEFTEGRPVLLQINKSESTPVYKKFWFYIIIALILLLLLVLLLLLLIRRKPKRIYKVSERERKHAPKEAPVELGEEHPLYAQEPDENGHPQGKTYGPVKPQRTLDTTVSPPTSEPGSTNNPERDSLDDYDGEEDDFSEHGSFIGQYGPGERPSASQSSLPNFV